MVSPTELPDYRPAFGPGATRVDADGNLWIRTSQNVDARPVYNVVNREGALVDRVQLPKNRVLAGFGAGGTVYLAVRDGTTAHLEAARVR
jgi:sugar lactone lactonase YvrE